MANPAIGVWSTGWVLALVRLTVVGVGTGAFTGAALVLVVVALGRGTLLDAGGTLLFGLVAGAAFSLPMVFLSAVTGLVVAAWAPQRRALTLGLLLVWPLVLTALAVSFFASNEGYELGPSILGAVVLLALVAAAVLTTSRWVTSPLR